MEFLKGREACPSTVQADFILKETHKMMKKYNIKPENMVADYQALKFLFLSGRDTPSFPLDN